MNPMHFLLAGMAVSGQVTEAEADELWEMLKGKVPFESPSLIARQVSDALGEMRARQASAPTDDTP